MTAAELLRQARKRHPILGYTKFTAGSLRRWLNTRVEAGWLTVKDGRYFLTAEGLEVARALAGVAASVDNGG